MNEKLYLPSQSFFRATIDRLQDDLVEVKLEDGRTFVAFNSEENEKHPEGRLTGVISGTVHDVHMTLFMDDFETVRKEPAEDQLYLSNDWGLGPVSSNWKFRGRLNGLYNWLEFGDRNPGGHEARCGFLMQVPFPVYVEIWLSRGQKIRDGCIVKGFNAWLSVESAESYSKRADVEIVSSAPGIKVPVEWESL